MGPAEGDYVCVLFDYVLHDVEIQQFSLGVFFRPHPSIKAQVDGNHSNMFKPIRKGVLYSVFTINWTFKGSIWILV